jgi:hypothetical protein
LLVTALGEVDARDGLGVEFGGDVRLGGDIQDRRLAAELGEGGRPLFVAEVLDVRRRRFLLDPSSEQRLPVDHPCQPPLGGST